MGNICSTQKQKQHPHPMLQNTLQHHTQDKSYIKKKIQFTSKQQYNQWINSIKNGPANETQFSFIPQNFKQYSANPINKTMKVQILYPPHWTNLQIEIKERQYINNSAEQRQIWLFMRNISEVGAAFHKNNEKVGDIRPYNILLDKNGHLKIITKYSWPGEQNNYMKMLTKKQKTYLAPEQVHQALLGYREEITDFKEGQSFSVGLTGIDCVLLQDSYDMYGTKKDNDGIKQEINMKILQNKRQRVQSDRKYSQILKKLLLNLTEIQPQKRLLLTQLYEWLKDIDFTPQRFLRDSLLQNQPAKLRNEHIALPSMPVYNQQLNSSSVPIYNRNLTKYSSQQYNEDQQQGMMRMNQPYPHYQQNNKQVQQIQKYDKKSFMKAINDPYTIRKSKNNPQQSFLRLKGKSSYWSSNVTNQKKRINSRTVAPFHGYQGVGPRFSLR